VGTVLLALLLIFYLLGRSVRVHSNATQRGEGQVGKLTILKETVWKYNHLELGEVRETVIRYGSVEEEEEEEAVLGE
jgi:hypothetical protein